MKTQNIYYNVNKFFQKTGFEKDLSYKDFCEIVNKEVEE